MKLPDRYQRALKDSPNVIGVASMVALSLATFSPLPILAGVVAEAAYLLFVPDSPWFRRRLEKIHAGEEAARRQAYRDRVLPTLRPLDQDRYRVLEQTRAEIETQESAALGAWFHEVLGKLSFLLQQYLEFGTRAVQCRQYLVNLAVTQARLSGRQFRLPGQSGNTDSDGARAVYAREAPAEALIDGVLDFFDRQADRLARDMEREKDREVLDVMRKNAEVLRSSRESVAQIGRILRSLEGQLDLVANTFTLINTQIRTGSPERIVADVDEVVTQSEALAQAMHDFRPIEEAVARLGRGG